LKEVTIAFQMTGEDDLCLLGEQIQSSMDYGEMYLCFINSIHRLFFVRSLHTHLAVRALEKRKILFKSHPLDAWE